MRHEGLCPNEANQEQPRTAAEFLARELDSHPYQFVEVASAHNGFIDAGNLRHLFERLPVKALNVFSDGFVGITEEVIAPNSVKVFLRAGVGNFIYRSYYQRQQS